MQLSCFQMLSAPYDKLMHVLASGGTTLYSRFYLCLLFPLLLRLLLLPPPFGQGSMEPTVLLSTYGMGC